MLHSEKPNLKSKGKRGDSFDLAKWDGCRSRDDGWAGSRGQDASMPSPGFDKMKNLRNGEHESPRSKPSSAIAVEGTRTGCRRGRCNRTLATA
jgi:hypothetical protein